MSNIRDILSSNRLKGLRIRLFSDYNEEVIKRIYYYSAGEVHKLESEHHKKIAQIKESDLSEQEINEECLFLEDDAFEAKLVRDAAEEMVIVCLYKTVEISIKRMLHASNLFSEEEVRGFFRNRVFKRLVKEKIVDLEALPGYESYDELRCINNCIKHSGFVDKELAKYGGWKKGEKLDSLWCNYERLSPKVRVFVEALSEKIIEKNN